MNTILSLLWMMNIFVPVHSRSCVGKERHRDWKRSNEGKKKKKSMNGVWVLTHAAAMCARNQSHTPPW